MFDMLTGLDVMAATSLLVALAFVLAFEFINGFHDTANAVATVIYTNAMTPNKAVALSGVCNFLGVMTGGVGVAYAIVHLLPVEMLLNVNASHGLVMVFSLLAAAIIWNLGTWFFGIPASSSHTLIGSMLGVGLANALMNGIPVSSGVNWGKAYDIGLSLVISPMAGFLAAFLGLIVIRRYWPLSKINKTPEERRAVEGKKHPPFWTRLTLVVSSMLVSFFHGSNDGQKGIGLLMLVLIGLAPGNFVTNLDSTPYQIEHTRDAVVHLQQFYQRNHALVGEYLALGKLDGNGRVSTLKCVPEQTEVTLHSVHTALEGVNDYRQLSAETRTRIRHDLLCLDDVAKKVSKKIALTKRDKADLEVLRKDLTATIEYAPVWAIVAVALALGIGTMVGWKRVVLTVGEKIGRGGMTYGQGMVAQIVAACGIGVSTGMGVPVSTTHILSSAVAGGMVGHGVGIHSGTIKNILIAWVLTLPAAILLSASLFWAASKIIG